MSLLGLGGSAPMYGLKLPARSLCAVGRGPSKHVFLVGTCSAKEENELQVLEFDEEENEIKATAIYTHAPEIWQVSACPQDASICATAYTLGQSRRTNSEREIGAGEITAPPQQEN